MEKTAFLQLFEKYIGDGISAEELDQLFLTLQDDTEQEQWLQSIEAMLQNRSMHGLADAVRMKEVFQSILAGKEKPDAEPAPVININTGSGKKPWRWIAAAAVIIILVGGAALWFRQADQRPIVKRNDQFRNDPAPGGNKAILTLANGSRIVLDSVENGTLALQGNTKIIKTDSGKLAYLSAPDQEATAIAYNTLTTPRGGQYHLVLPDGSQVWLNAASTLRYPIAFSGQYRTVELKGEGYFEVAAALQKNGQKIPFKVLVNEVSIEVLGTHFNIMAYENENAIQATLLEGAVKITVDSAQMTDDRRNNYPLSTLNRQLSAILKPDQQASISRDGKISVEEVIAEDAIAWKKGLFNFDGAAIPEVMRQLTRWYDVEVKYEGKVPQDHLTGTVSRNSSLSKLMEMLKINNIQSKLEGKTLIISEK